MNTDVPGIGISEFALRASTQPGWSILIVEPDQAVATLVTLMEELRDLDDTPVLSIDPSTAESFAERLQTSGEATVILSGLEAFTENDWQHIDLLRSRLARQGSTILLLSTAATIRLTESAPNLSSWLGSTVWRLDASANILSPQESEQRLARLRDGLAMSDAEVVALAQQGKLPRDPEFAEWLALLGRGDLVPRA